MDMTLRALEAEARRRVEAVVDDPEGRYRMRASFYQRFGEARVGRPGGFGGYSRLGAEVPVKRPWLRQHRAPP